MAETTRVFFDLGDTLIDLSGLVPSMAYQIREAYPPLAERAGSIARSWVVGTAEATASAHTRPFRPGVEIAGDALCAAFQDEGKGLDLSEAVHMAREAWNLYLNQAKFHPDVTPDLLLLLRAKTKALGIITDCDTPIVEPLLSQLRIRDLFQVVIVSDAVRAYKPSPSIYLAALEEGGGTPDEAAFVSNSILDVQGAKAVGMRTVWVRRGKPSPPSGISGPLVIHDLRELPEILFAE